MSKYGMFGLLEGAGKGMTGTGESMVKASLQQAEEQRLMNLQRIKRQWDKEDTLDNRVYAEGQKVGDRQYAEKVDLEQEGRTNARQDVLFDKTADLEETRYSRGREDTLADRQFEVNNRQASESDKLIARADAALKAGTIDQPTYNKISLGLKSDDGALTAKDKAQFRLDSFEQATLEIRGKDPMNPVTPEQTKAINQRAGEIYNSALGAGPAAAEKRVLPPGAEDKYAKTFAALSETDKKQAVSDLKASGVADQSITNIVTKAAGGKAPKATGLLEGGGPAAPQGGNDLNPNLSVVNQQILKGKQAEVQRNLAASKKETEQKFKDKFGYYPDPRMTVDDIENVLSK